MIDELKELSEENTVYFTDDAVIDFTEAEEMRVTAVKSYSSDDSEIVIVELEDFYLIAHNLDTEPKYFIYQMMDSGRAEELEKDGYCFLTEDLDFRNKIVSREDARSYVYKHSEMGPLYELSLDRDDYEDEDAINNSLCEYVCSSHHLDHILIEKTDTGDQFSDIRLNIYQGFRIKESHFDLT